MKILLIHQYFLGENDPGGSRFNQFVKHWTSLGHEVTVIAGTVHYATGQKDPRYKGKWIVKERPHPLVTVYRCYVSEEYNKHFFGRLWGYLSFVLSSLWAALIHAGKHDVMVVTSPPLFVGLTGILVSRLRRIPMVFEVRDLWPESAIDAGVVTNPLLIRLAYALERSCYRVARLVNVLTPAFREVLIQRKGVPAEKIRLIPNGADLDLFQPGERDNWVRETYGLQDKFVVTYMGAHGVANGLWSLLHAAEACRDLDDVVFLLIGDGMEKPKLEAYAKQTGLTNVKFLPSQPKRTIPDFCRASDVCVAVLKKAETFKTVYPNKVFDYMSCAKPILLGIDGVARDLVESCEAGWYVDPDDPEDFRRRLLDLYRNPALREAMGQNGYQFVSRHFSRANLADQYERELKEMLSKNRQFC